MESGLSQDMQALALTGEERPTYTSTQEKVDGVSTSVGEVYLLPIQATDLVRQRREELVTLVKDALEHLSSDDSRALREGVRLLVDRICKAFQLERERVQVEVIGDDCQLPWSCERRRLEEAHCFLQGMVWRSTNYLRDYHCMGDTLGSLVFEPWFSFRTNEMEAFQTAIYARNLADLVKRLHDVEGVYRKLCSVYDSTSYGFKAVCQSCGYQYSNYPNRK